MSEMLELSGITKGYNRGKPSEVLVLRGVDLRVSRGEVVALVAPSGAGKSTLLHIAGLLDVPDGGTVRLDGREMGGLSDKARTEARRDEVGFIYQFHHLLPEFSALENVVIPQLANGVAKGQAEARASSEVGSGVSGSSSSTGSSTDSPSEAGASTPSVSRTAKPTAVPIAPCWLPPQA